MDEDVLIARAVAGDSEAFSELVRRYQNMAYHVAFRILGNTDDAEDATQDAFLSAYRALKRFRHGSFRAWLMRIVTNACYDSLRRARHRAAASLDSGEDAERQECLVDPGASPEAMAERQDQSRQVQHALAALPPRQRVVVVLRDIQGLDYAEIAQVLRVPVGTVRSRLSRGRRALSDRLLQVECSSPTIARYTELMNRPASSGATASGSFAAGKWGR
jgi:RNA polymerase sigma-70 factor (ECF subfamily)